MSRFEFARYVQEFLTIHPGIQALVWVPRVRAEQRPKFESAARNEGFDFQFTERAFDGSMVRAGDRPDYFPIYAIEPFRGTYRGTEATLGFDLGSDPGRKQLLSAIADRARISAIAALSPTSSNVAPESYIILDPMYAQSGRESSLIERRGALTGFAMGVLRTRQVVDASRSDWNLDGVAMWIDDDAGASGPVRIYESSDVAEALNSPFTWTLAFPVADRTWHVTYAAGPSYMRANRTFQAWGVLAAGLLFVGLLQAMLLGMVGQTRRVEQRVGERTRELAREVAEREKVEFSLRKLSRAVEQSPVAVAITDTEGVIEYVNPAYSVITGHTETEARGMTLTIDASGDSRSRVDEALWRTVADGQTWKGEIRSRRKNGDYYWEDVTISPVFGPGRTVTHFLVVKNDVSERKDTEAKLRQINADLASTVASLETRDREAVLFGRMNDLFLTCQTRDEAFDVVRITASQFFPNCRGGLAVLVPGGTTLETAVQWGGSEFLRPSFEVDDCWAMRHGRLYAITEPHHSLVCSHFTARPTSGYLCLPLIIRGTTLGLLWIEDTDGVPATQAARNQRIIALGDAIKLVLSNLDLKDALQRQATRDPLTDLYNRRFLDDAVKREIARTKRTGGPLSVAVIDIDHFKKINDRYGHEAGDKVLREVADLLRETMRQNDIPCRFGGEEFVVILPDTDAAGAKISLDAMRARLQAKEIKYKSETIGPVTASVGIAQILVHGDDGEALIRAADGALYTAKEAGRNRVLIAPPPTA